MSSTVKCSGCNIVIDELLAFLKAKLSRADEESLVKICVSTFTSDDIQKSHTLLFESVPTELRKISRKGKGKEDRLLYDILHFLKVTEPDMLPVFVARDLEKLPPLTFDHLDVSKLLKDLALAQAEIMHIKSSYATVEQLELVKKECSGSKNVSPPFSAAKVNMKRGAYRNSGPIGLSLFEESFTSNDENKASCEPISDNDYSLHYRSINCQQLEGSAQATGLVTDQMSNAGACDNDSLRQVPSTTAVDRPRDQLTAAVSSVTINNNTYAQAAMKDDNEWKVVQKKVKKSKNRFAGKTGTVLVEPDEMFRAAERKVLVFISNVNENTCEKDIVRYIHNKTQEKVILEKIAIKRQCNYSAYKFFVPHTKLSMFLDDKIWPQGVIFRRFVNFKVSRTNVTSGKQDGAARVQK
jgi:hypothetical protein